MTDRPVTKKAPTQVVVDRLLDAGIKFREIPNKTKVVSKGNLRENLLVCVQDERHWTEDLGANIAAHPHKYGWYIECSLANSIRDLAKGTIYVHSSKWIHGRFNWPELRLATAPLSGSDNVLLFAIPPELETPAGS